MMKNALLQFEWFGLLLIKASFYGVFVTRVQLQVVTTSNPALSTKSHKV